jgi:hypothetical protein
LALLYQRNRLLAVLGLGNVGPVGIQQLDQTLARAPFVVHHQEGNRPVQLPGRYFRIVQ